MARYIEASEHADIYVPHAFEEKLADLGEIRMNYAVAGDPSSPALVLIPAQSESWWGYEDAMALLAEHFEVFAIDLRGQGRSTWTPGRYTLDNFGNDVLKFIDTVVQRPAIVSGLSSGGTISAWLSAFARPGQVVAAVWEDAPLFHSEARPAFGQGIRQGVGPLFALWNQYLGDQWSVGAFDAMQQALPTKLTPFFLRGVGAMFPIPAGAPMPDGPMQNLKEYDPEWGKAFVSGSATASCDHENMLQHVRVPVLMTHHWRAEDPETGTMMGAITDAAAARVREIVATTGQPLTYRSFPDVPHSMHGYQPQLFAGTVVDWARDLGLIG